MPPLDNCFLNAIKLIHTDLLTIRHVTALHFAHTALQAQRLGTLFSTMLT